MRFQKILLFGAIVIGFIAILWLIVCSLLEQRIPNALTPKQGYIFDYVVVGAGTAGSVVASLLAKHGDASILLLEAGGTFGIISKIPLLTTMQQKGVNDWSFLSVSQRNSSKGLQQQQQCLPRGKGLGGSAQLNYMLHFDGHPGDFNYWAKTLNLTEWYWEAFKPFMEAGKAKPYEMFEIPPNYSKVATAFYRAESELAHKSWRFRRARYNIKNGLRYSVLQRLLEPAMEHSNLHIMTNAMAKRINFIKDPLNDQQLTVKSLVVGVKDDETRKEFIFEVDIRRELVLSAGTYQSPQLLLVSGVGDSTDLEQRKIPLQLDLPHVGKNLHDHLNQPLFVSIGVVGPTLNQNALLSPVNLLNFLTTGGGHLGNFGVLGHIDDVIADKHKFALTLFGAGAIDENVLMTISNFKPQYFRALFPRYFNTSQEGFVLISTCLQPKSRGSVTVRNSNIRKNPLIDTNYLSEMTDINCMIRAIRSAVEVVTSDAFAELRPRIHWPKIKDCANFGPFERDFALNQPTDRYLECLFRHVGLGSHHPGGTCAMGTKRENSVVDAHFRVHGVKNLRVIDASVLPTPISGNPNSVIVGMAVRGATMILRTEINMKEQDEKAN